MNIKHFFKKNKYSLLILFFLLLIAFSVSAVYTVSKYIKSVPVYSLELEVTDDPPVLYRGFITEVNQNKKIPEFDGTTKIVMGSFNDYKEQLRLSDDDWKNCDERFYVQQQSAAEPEGDKLRGGIRLFFDESTGEKTVYVLAKGYYPVTFPEDSHNMFADLRHLWGDYQFDIPIDAIDFNKIDTSRVQNMRYMFWTCSALPTVDVSKFDTGKVTDMKGMFGGCNALSEIKLDRARFKTSEVTDMSEMFVSCNALRNLDVSGFDTSKVTDMNSMFYGCHSIQTLDVSKFNTGKVTNMYKMFSFCISVQKLDVSGFNTSNVTDMSYMFEDCRVITSLDLHSFNTSNVTDMRIMFANCHALQALDLSTFNTAKVTSMERMFAYCIALTSLQGLDNSNFDTSNVTDMSRMFAENRVLTSINVSKFKTGNVQNMAGMFRSCWTLTTLNVRNFDTRNVTDMHRMFFGCSGLTELDLSGFNTSAVKNMYRMFKDSWQLKTIYVNESKWSTASLADSNTVKDISTDQDITVSGKVDLFMNAWAIVGGNGTPSNGIEYNDPIGGITDYQYARVDKAGQPGYFTDRAS
mgnify:CR=1 FL=1